MTIYSPVLYATADKYFIRRLIGRDFSDPSLQDDILRLPYEVVDKEGKPVIKVDVKDADIYLTPEEISAKVIEKLKYMAQEHLNRTVASAVLTVPSYFNEKQLQATKDAAVIAGLNALRLVKEPTAAGIAHGLERQNDQTFNIILNLGAKELDVALADVELGVYEILANATDTTLGGEDITSNEFLELEEDFGNQALGLVKRVLKEGKVGKIAINDIIFTGNPTHISKIQPFIEAHFDGKKALYTNGVHPEEAIVRGAALQGAVLSGNYEDICSMPLLDVVRLSLGIETSGGIFTKIIPRHTIIPTRKIHEFTTVTKGQNTVVVDIFDGERAVASANKALGRLQLSGLSREPTIQVTFEIDANEILTVAVKDKGTGNEVSFGWPVGRERYTWEESDQIVMDAEKYWDADQLLLKEGPANIEEWNKQHSFGLRSLS